VGAAVAGGEGPDPDRRCVVSDFLVAMTPDYIKGLFLLGAKVALVDGVYTVSGQPLFEFKGGACHWTDGVVVPFDPAKYPAGWPAEQALVIAAIEQRRAAGWP
jgi:hypothetical protein